MIGVVLNAPPPTSVSVSRLCCCAVLETHAARECAGAPPQKRQGLLASPPLKLFDGHGRGGGTRGVGGGGHHEITCTLSGNVQTLQSHSPPHPPRVSAAFTCRRGGLPSPSVEAWLGVHASISHHVSHRCLLESPSGTNFPSRCFSLKKKQLPDALRSIHSAVYTFLDVRPSPRHPQ